MLFAGLLYKRFSPFLRVLLKLQQTLFQLYRLPWLFAITTCYPKDCIVSINPRPQYNRGTTFSADSLKTQTCYCVRNQMSGWTSWLTTFILEILIEPAGGGLGLTLVPAPQALIPVETFRRSSEA